MAAPKKAKSRHYAWQLILYISNKIRIVIIVRVPYDICQRDLVPMEQCVYNLTERRDRFDHESP